MLDTGRTGDSWGSIAQGRSGEAKLGPGAELGHPSPPSFLGVMTRARKQASSGDRLGIYRVRAGGTEGPGSGGNWRHLQKWGRGWGMIRRDPTGRQWVAQGRDWGKAAGPAHDLRGHVGRGVVLGSREAPGELWGEQLPEPASPVGSLGRTVGLTATLQLLQAVPWAPLSASSVLVPRGKLVGQSRVTQDVRALSRK